MTLQQLAKICHEANRAYCETLGDYTQPPWAEASMWQTNSTVAGINAHLNNVLSPEEIHQHWVEFQLAEGWKWGAEKNVAKKEHPCMVPWTELPEEQRHKDRLFSAIVGAFRGSVK